MPTYKATKAFHFGALRAHVQAGETLEYDGFSVVVFRGRPVNVAGFEAIVDAGLVALADPGSALAVLSTPPVRVETPAPVPARENPDKAHVWGGGGFGDSGYTCTVCGVSMRATGLAGDLQVDRPSLGFRYTDAYGVTIDSLTELPCPVFIGQMGGAVAGTTHRVRKLSNKVETIEERVTRLEAENTRFREVTDHRQQEALALLQQLVAQTQSTVDRPALPDHAQIIDAMSFDEVDPERIRIKALEEEADELLASLDD